MAETFGAIKSLVRDLSNQHNRSDLSDSNLGVAVNNWYQNKLPSEVSLSLERTWKFSTLPYQDVYTVEETYSMLDGDVRLNGSQIAYFIEPDVFYDNYPDTYSRNLSLGTGNGSTTNFTGNLVTDQRVLPGSVVIATPVESFDDPAGDGVLTGSNGGTGTIVYSTGAFDITFGVAPADGIAIGSSFVVINESEPSAVLYYQRITDDSVDPPLTTRSLTFRPIPDGAYMVEVDYEARPVAMTADSDTPIRRCWGDLIAYGTAIDILERFGSFDEAEAVKNAYRRILDGVLGYEVKIQSNASALPMW